MATSKDQGSFGFVDNWQAGKTLAQCNLHMLKTEDSCDVIFRCGENGHTIKGHRFVLISRSCVFHAMLSGPLAEKSDIKVPEIKATFFKQLLIYLYTNDITIDSDNATALLYCARKYAVSGLEKKCKEYLEKNLTVENACVILEASHRFDQKELYEKALTLIKGEGERSLQFPGFLTLSQVLVDQIIESDDLNAEEHVVFTAVNNWAEAECGRQGREITPEAKRSVLGETLLKIRFPLVTQTFFVDKVKASGLLTNEERLMLLEYFISPVGNVHPFKNTPRQPAKMTPQQFSRTSKRRFTSHSVNAWNVGKAIDAISFKSNKNIVIRGYQLYSRYEIERGRRSSRLLHYGDIQKIVYSVTSYFGSDDTVLDTAVQKDVVYTAAGKVFDVIFPHPVSVTAGEWYTLAVLMIGHNTWRGAGGMSRVVCDDGVEFDFSNTSKSINTTSVDHGQIPSLIYSLM